LGSHSSTIEILWPPAGLSEQGWRDRVEHLATRAEALIGRKCTLQQTAELAVEFLGLAWGAFSPETIAGSARASLAVGPPGLLLAAPALDQAAEIAARLDRLWEVAQVDPAAAVVTLAPPMMQQVVPPGKKAGRPKRLPEPELITQSAEPDHSGDAAELLQSAPEDHPGDAEPITQAAAAELDAWGFPVEPAPLPPAPEPEPALPEPEPAPEPPPNPLPDTTGWWSVADAGELLGVHKGTLSRWRLQGRLGLQGVDWMRSGRSFALSPAILDRLLSEPPGNGVPEPDRISAESSENGSQQLELVAETQS